jgi:hypothetical protein
MTPSPVVGPDRSRGRTVKTNVDHEIELMRGSAPRRWLESGSCLGQQADFKITFDDGLVVTTTSHAQSRCAVIVMPTVAHRPQGPLYDAI